VYIPQKRFASVKTLVKTFNITPKVAKEIRALVKGEEYPTRYQSVQKHPYGGFLGKEERILVAINELLDLYGGEHWIRGDASLAGKSGYYCNTGDFAYGTTIFWNDDTQTFQVGCIARY
jgi:hypothetical protein